MYTGIKHIHSFTAYLVLVFLIIAVVYAFYSWYSAKPFNQLSKIITLLGLIATHTQLLFGLLLYFFSPLGGSSFSGEAMKNPVSRFYILEHPIMMVAAFVLITYGYSKAKKMKTDKAKFGKIALFYTLGLLCILSRIPWRVWL